MKIFAAGDIHGDTTLAQRLAQRAADDNAELVILCGDITFFDTSTDNLLGPFKNAGLKVLLIPGNHEGIATTDFLAELYDIRNLHGYSVKYKDIGIFGAGGSTQVGPSPVVDEDEMFDLLKKGFERIRYLPKKIMVTHEHPSGSKMEFNKMFQGSGSIRKAIDEFKPDLLLCGHIHEAEGIEEKLGDTTVINVGKEGRVFDI